MLSNPPRIPSGDETTDRAITPLRQAIVDIIGTPLLNGRYHEAISLANGVTYKLAHGLGRKWRGWIVCNLENAAGAGYINHIPGTPGASEQPNRELWLQANSYGATITVNLWVF